MLSTFVKSLPHGPTLTYLYQNDYKIKISIYNHGIEEQIIATSSGLSLTYV